MNDQLQIARRIIEETGTNLFLTGKAGTGKTTFLRNLAERSNKRMVILAPTGVAAINAGGATIHSFFQFDFSPYIPGKGFASGEKPFRYASTKRQIMATLDLLVIDEISMVRPDVLDAIDASLRRMRDPRRPFGGVQLLMIGDLRQLAPVVQEQEWSLLEPYYKSPYFFDSIALNEAGFVTVELSRVYRQDSPEFIALLNAIRDGRADDSTLAALNSRCIPGFNPPDEEGYIRLTTHIHLADAVNASRLEAISAPEKVYKASVEGSFPSSAYPAEEELHLKVGAQVMFIKNDSGKDRKFYNGMIGTVVSAEEEKVIVRPADSEECVDVVPADWERMKYSMDRKSGEIGKNVEGTFTQMPLRLAWAITIHKSQGLTFDRAIINAARSFAPGQTYVALSRCRTLEGLVLDSPIPHEAIITDNAVSGFIARATASEPGDAEVDAMRAAYCRSQIADLFDFNNVRLKFADFERLVSEYVILIHLELGPKYKEVTELIKKRIVAVGDRSGVLLAPPELTPESLAADTAALQKIRSGCLYFREQLKAVVDLVSKTPIDLSNKHYAERLANSYEALAYAVNLKVRVLQSMSSATFSPETYAAAKTKAVLACEGVRVSREEPSVQPKKKKEKKPVGYSMAETAKMFNAGQSIEQIVEARGLSRSTILTHIAQAIKTGQTQRDRIFTPGTYEWLEKNYPAGTWEQFKNLIANIPSTAPSLTPTQIEIYFKLHRP